VRRKGPQTAEAGGEEAFDGRAFARTLTREPGVYRMLGSGDEVLYVGKARNLRHRVESYFARGAHDARITSMVMQVRRIEVMVTRTEAEALLLESQLIKALKPRYNIDLRDDKSYPWIRLTAADEFPRLAFHRGAKLPGDRYFGPFPSAWAVRETLSLIFRTFGVRQCEDSVFRHRTRPCLQHQIGRCSAPCVGLVDRHEYAAAVRHACQVLEGRSAPLIDELTGEMERSAQALDFERAARLRDQVAALRRVLSPQFVQGEKGDLDVLACVSRNGKACVEVLFFRGGMSLGNRSWFPRFLGEAGEGEILRAFILQHYTSQSAPAELLLSHAIEDEELVAEVLGEQAGRKVRIVHAPRAERARWVEMAMRTAEAALATELAANATLRTRQQSLRELLGLDEPPARIECFDISHTQGEGTVASCVVFDARGPLKSDYRRFRIEGIAPGDDYAAMRQALSRRFARLAKGEGVMPELLLIDGGIGQVRQALEVLAELGIEGPLVVGVAKGPERKPGAETLLIAPAMTELVPGPASPALHLIQQVRDEAHRFAITGHRAARAKARQKGTLDEVPGVGTKRKRELLKAFGGLRGILRASVEDLMTVDGIDRALAERIHAHLHGQ
jgi:excinuclease ABC subunit C